MAGIEAFFQQKKEGLSSELAQVNGDASIMNNEIGVVIEHIPNESLVNISQSARNQFQALGDGELFRISKNGKSSFLRASTLTKARERVSFEIEKL